MPTLLAGILAFFLLEKLVLWRHCHDAHECEVHTSSAASLVIVGDAFHTFVDGAVIAAAVVTSIPLGITTALAVATHEIPQEVGDVAILLRAGYSRLRAFTLNLLSGLGGILGAIAMIFATKALPHALPYVLSFAAGNFLYVAMADLIPDLHRGGLEGGPLRQLLLIGVGSRHDRHALKSLTSEPTGTLEPGTSGTSRTPRTSGTPGTRASLPVHPSGRKTAGTVGSSAETTPFRDCPVAPPLP